MTLGRAVKGLLLRCPNCLRQAQPGLVSVIGYVLDEEALQFLEFLMPVAYLPAGLVYVGLVNLVPAFVLQCIEYFSVDLVLINEYIH